MSMIDRSLDGMAFLSGQLGAVLQRRLRELGGIALLSLAMIAALALASWSVDDPSLSHATDARVHNLLGRPGAIAADLMMQLLGLGSLALLLPIAVWGYRLLGHRPLRHERLRVLLWLFGAVLAAAFASSLPRGVRWPLPCGLGGVVGDAILRLPAALFGTRLTGTYGLIAASVLGVAALAAFGGAAGIFLRGARSEEEEPVEAEADDDDEADDGAWISLGGLMHTVLSFRSRLTRMFRRAARPSTQAAGSGRGDASGQRRVEPRLDGPRHSRIGEEDDDESEDEDGDEPAPRAARKPRATIKPTRRSNGGYVLPPLDLLSQPSKLGRATVSSDTLRENSTALEGVLADFGVRGEIIKARPGPVVTLYELEPAPGIKSSRVISLADDIARSMSALLRALP